MALDLAWIRERLPAREIVWLDATSSTMHDAASMASVGCASGSLVGAEQQLAGQGRHGRNWHSEREAGLYFTAILRLGCPPESLPVATLALGLAVQEGVLRATGIACDLRWPNDVLIGSAKCAGILTQLHESAVLAGIGINVNHISFPAGLEGGATSLRLASGSEQSRERLLVATLESIDSFAALLASQGKEPVLRMFSQASSYVRGRRVLVDQGDSVVRGTTDGLDSSGFLILRRDDGSLLRILAGGVRPV